LRFKKGDEKMANIKIDDEVLKGFLSDEAIKELKKGD